MRPADTGSLWAPENLAPLIVPLAVPLAEQQSGPEGRARVLAELGIKRLSYFWPGLTPVVRSWEPAHVPSRDAELDAFDAHGIELLAHWFPVEADDPAAEETFKLFERRGLRPQTWIMQSLAEFPQSPEAWAEIAAAAAPFAADGGPGIRSPEARMAVERAMSDRVYEPSLTRTPEEQAERIEREVERVRSMAALAAAYGGDVCLYNHHGWFGLIENQLAILERLIDGGTTNVGIVYTFSHARDAFHDDTTDFPSFWKTIERHVRAINIGGTRIGGTLTYPSQDDRELEMMRTIEQSGWRGPVAMKAMHNEDTGSTAVTLRNMLAGVAWCAAELERPGSGGPRPFPEVTAA